ncbi:MAG: hypothetical protein ACRDTC_07000 [Pseudonocardiaceae bacterium]
MKERSGEREESTPAGKQLSSHALTGVIMTVEVPPPEWVDLAHIQAQGQRWLATHHERRKVVR